MTAHGDGVANDAVPELTGRRRPWLDRMLEDRERLSSLVELHGSPINLLCAAPLVENHAALRGVAERHHLDVMVCYARKANRSRALVAAASAAGAGVDTASLTELNESIALGLPGSRLVVTAAVKPAALLRRALEVGAIIVVDNADEAAAVHALAADAPREPVIALRVSGFTHGGNVGYSRFGVDLADAVRFVQDELGPTLRPSGLHFHLDGYSTAQRAEALHQCLDLTDELGATGVDITSIDIGGGLRVRYLEDDAQLETFWAELRRALRGERSPLTFGGDGLGLEVVDGQVTGEPKVYPFADPRPGPLFLDDVLTTTDASGRSAAERLRRSGIQLRLEPGRALLDGVGATVGRIIHRKRDRNDDLLIGVEMNGTQHGSSSADILVDPILISTGQGADPAAPTEGVSAYLTGAYCTEGDLLLRRRIPLPHMPEVGDLLVFVNTAGYSMHFRAAEGHRFGQAQDLVVSLDAAGRVAAVDTDEHVEAIAVHEATAPGLGRCGVATGTVATSRDDVRASVGATVSPSPR